MPSTRFHATAPSFLVARLPFVCAVALLLFCLLLGFPVHAARLALVIGNDGYRQIEPLTNARNDARLMAATLKEAGFEVERVHENLNRKDMLRAINTFKARITKRDEVVFFYAGHGVQFGQQSPVLLPIDISHENADQVVQDGVLLSTVQEAVKEAQFAMLVIDACRNNPFPPKPDGTRGLTLPVGLALTQPAEGSVIIMSAATGQKALDYVPDGTHSNGLFTHEFVQTIKTPGQNIIASLYEVRNRVQAKARKAGNAQRPAFVDESGGSFVFFAARALAVLSVPAVPSVQLTSEQEVEQKLWNAIEVSSDALDFQDYLKRYPNGRFAPLAHRQVRVLTARLQPASQVPNSANDVQPRRMPNTEGAQSTGLPLKGSSTQQYSCDQRVEDSMRLGHSYTLGDVYANKQSFRHNIAKSQVILDETESGNLNRGDGPEFSFDPKFSSQGYEVLPGQSIKTLTSAPYLVFDFPTNRNKKLVVAYQYQVQAQRDDQSWTHPVPYTSCVSYMVTRCGDGFVDHPFEICDAGDTNGKPGNCKSDCSGIRP